MLLWFLGTALLSVFFVFTDPRFDYRLLLVGSVLPDLIDDENQRFSGPSAAQKFECAIDHLAHADGCVTAALGMGPGVGGGIGGRIEGMQHRTGP